MQKTKAIFNWSGGKDSALCLHKLMKSQTYQISYLLTTVSEQYRRISQHGVRENLLEKQTVSIGLPLYKLIMPGNPTMDSYNSLMASTLEEFKKENIHISIFGDIFLEDLRKYREERLALVNFRGVFPLWKVPTGKLVREFIDLGFKAILVCTDSRYLDKSFVGREIDNALLRDLPANVDPCGENGEFHSFVYDGPIFNNPVLFKKGEIVYRTYTPPKQIDNQSYVCGSDKPAHKETGFWYCDLIAE